MTDNLLELVIYIAKNLVTCPDSVTVNEVQKDDGSTVFELRVAPEDMGRVIGRGGRIAKSIRAVVRAAARENRKVSIEIVDK